MYGCMFIVNTHIIHYACIHTQYTQYTNTHTYTSTYIHTYTTMYTWSLAHINTHRALLKISFILSGLPYNYNYTQYLPQVIHASKL